MGSCISEMAFARLPARAASIRCSKAQQLSTQRGGQPVAEGSKAHCTSPQHKPALRSASVAAGLTRVVKLCTLPKPVRHCRAWAAVAVRRYSICWWPAQGCRARLQRAADFASTEKLRAAAKSCGQAAASQYASPQNLQSWPQRRHSQHCSARLAGGFDDPRLQLFWQAQCYHTLPA